MENYEKLGAFYLGKRFDQATGKLAEDLILYDSKDLTTHALIIGMTGSGKTGLGLCLLEEALIDQVPVIAIDPKGDLTNLLLTFPNLAASDFRPWVSEQEAMAQGMDPDRFAKAQADLWRKGLASWGQEPERIARLRQAAELAVYTPGSSAGRPISLLRGFAPPPSGMAAEPDYLRERIATTTQGLLTLLDLEADPITSREHILIANILEQAWAEGRTLDLAGLIRAVQAPPFQRVGVMEVESFYPQKERFALAMRINNLLAAPGFEAWLSGEPLEVGRLLYTPQGRPRAAIFTISHLSEAQRMFFVTMLLSEVLAWARSQPGSGSLRAVLYMDEIMGYVPPLGNPPSKTPMLTLLKQARAYGLGVVLSTQNPVDLDYKGLSNTGTWFIGRMQAERDKERVMSGLLGASAGAALNKADLERVMASLGKRTFLLHNVHETAPVVFQARWALSYLAGPLTREQIRRLPQSDTAMAAPAAAPTPASAMASPAPADATQGPPLLPPDVEQRFLPASGAGAGLMYLPAVLGLTDVHYFQASKQVSLNQELALAALLEPESADPQWDDALELSPEALEQSGAALAGADFGELPSAASQSASYKTWQKDLLRFVRQNKPLVLYRSQRLKLDSRPGEDEGAFRARLATALRETRDLEVEKLRRRYQSKFVTLQNRMLRAQQAVSREQEQAKASQFDTVVSIGTALLGAFLGRKTVSSTSVSRAGTAAKSARRTAREKQDVARAQETLEAVRQEMEDLEARLKDDIAGIEASLDPAAEEISEILIKPKSTDLAARVFCLAWLPFRRDAAGRLSPDWPGAGEL